jgi:hypothetical protein
MTLRLSPLLLTLALLLTPALAFRPAVARAEGEGGSEAAGAQPADGSSRPIERTCVVDKRRSATEGRFCARHARAKVLLQHVQPLYCPLEPARTGRLVAEERVARSGLPAGWRTADHRTYELVASPIESLKPCTPVQRCQRHEGWPESVCRDVIDERVRVGMTKQQVRAAVGIASSIQRKESAQGDELTAWVYSVEGGVAFGLLGLLLQGSEEATVDMFYVVFRDGEAIDIQERTADPDVSYRAVPSLIRSGW